MGLRGSNTPYKLDCAWFSLIAENFKPILGGVEREEQESISNNDNMAVLLGTINT